MASGCCNLNSDSHAEQTHYMAMNNAGRHTMTRHGRLESIGTYVYILCEKNDDKKKYIQQWQDN